jgi:hypothetical protein
MKQLQLDTDDRSQQEQQIMEKKRLEFEKEIAALATTLVTSNQAKEELAREADEAKSQLLTSKLAIATMQSQVH